MSDSTILAIGAAGPFAGLVVPALAARGARVRALVRKPKEGEAVRRGGAAEVAVGDLTDPASIGAALRGVDAVFYIAPAFIADEAAIGRRVVDEAKRAGVRRFVFSSVIDPVISALDNHAAKAPVEEALIESGLEFALLQPTMFFQNMAQGWPSVLQTGTYGEPWSAETRFNRVDYRDVAEVAAMALTEDRLLYGTYQLCAEGRLNRREVAALMGEVLGRTITATTSSVPAPAPTGDDPQAAGARKMFAWYDHHGLLGNALTLRAILGHEPRTLRAYFEELVANPRPAAHA